MGLTAEIEQHQGGPEREGTDEVPGEAYETCLSRIYDKERALALTCCSSPEAGRKA